MIVFLKIKSNLFFINFHYNIINMKILNKLVLFSSMLSIVYASSINNFSHQINLTQQNVVKADVTGGYTVLDFCVYLHD